MKKKLQQIILMKFHDYASWSELSLLGARESVCCAEQPKQQNNQT